MKAYSELLNKWYEAEDCVFFPNAKQSCFYKLYGAELVDLIPTDELRWIFVFYKTDHYRLRDLWNATNPNK